MKSACNCILLVTVLTASAGADVTLFSAWKPDDASMWHGGARIVPTADRGTVIYLEKPTQPAWMCWLPVDNWEAYETLVITLDSEQAGRVLGVAVSDDEEYSVAVAVRLAKGENTISLPVARLFAAGLQTRYVRGIALWSRQEAFRVSLDKVRLVGKGGDLSKIARRGTRVLTDAERRDANFFWSYSHWARRVSAVEKHPASGKRSFEMKFSGKHVVSSWGRFPHDWRGYDALTFEVYNPKKKSVRLTVNLKDSWIPLISSAYVVKREFALSAEKTTTVKFPLVNLEGKSGKTGEGKLKPEYIQQMYFQLAEEDTPGRLYIDDIRLVGKPGRAFPNEIARAEVPRFGFEQSSDTLALKANFRKLRIPEPEEGFAKLSVGAAKVRITPKVGTRMASVSSRSEGILDDIYVRVLLLQEEDKDLVVWLHIDNLYIPGRKEVPPLLQEKLGVKPENIFWSATHNHNSGAPWASKTFNQQIVDGFVEAAQTAAATMKPVRMAVATTRTKLNFNRVMKGPDGKIYGMLDAKYMSFLMDSRPTDEELAMIWFVGMDDRPVAGVVYYSGHPNMLCRVIPWISGDWSGWTERLLEASSGAVVMHIQGAMGDVDMRGGAVSIGRTIRAGWDVARAAARATQKNLRGVNASSLARVSVRHGEGMGSPSAKDVEKGVKEHPLPVHVLTIGPVAFVDVGGELWTEFALEIRAKSSFPSTYNNFSSGFYFPKPWAFDKKLYGTAGRRPDWGPTLVDTALKVLKEAAGNR